MAYHADQSSVQTPQQFTNKVRKREDLEREVSFLQQMLADEEKIRGYLEDLHLREDHSAVFIPNSLPPKMKGLLSELSTVESEISRLETQIKQLQDEVKQEKEANMANQKSMRTCIYSPPLSPVPNVMSRKNDDKVAFKTKSLHFINKAIKGDYSINDFIKNERSVNSKDLLSQRGSLFRQEGEEGEAFRDKTFKRNVISKPPSPSRDRRRSASQRDHNVEFLSEVSPKLLHSTPHSEEESIHKWSPNKLSESIMKCLLFIFVRLLRTSRLMELEKSGQVPRSSSFSLRFKAETNLILQKNSGQQDPYGIFNSEGSIPRDIGPYKNLVRFTPSSMDLKCIQNSSSVPLFQKLKMLADGLEKVDLRFLNHHQKLAFWINMYNACIMHVTIPPSLYIAHSQSGNTAPLYTRASLRHYAMEQGYLQHGLPSVSSPDHLQAIINKATLNIAGNTISAREIEHIILRKPQDSLVKDILGKVEIDNKEMTIYELYGIQKSDPNVTFAFCRGTHSSPAVKTYTPEGVSAELEKSKLEYLQAAIVVTREKRIALPELLLRNMHNFAADEETLVEWVMQQLPTSGSLRKSMVECFRVLNGGKVSAIVEKIPYNFEFQYLLAI